MNNAIRFLIGFNWFVGRRFLPAPGRIVFVSHESPGSPLVNTGVNPRIQGVFSGGPGE